MFEQPLPVPIPATTWAGGHGGHGDSLALGSSSDLAQRAGQGQDLGVLQEKGTNPPGAPRGAVAAPRAWGQQGQGLCVTLCVTGDPECPWTHREKLISTNAAHSQRDLRSPINRILILY